MTTPAPSVAATSVLALLCQTTARNGTFCADNLLVSSRPILPVAPVMRRVNFFDSGISSSFIIALSQNPWNDRFNDRGRAFPVRTVPGLFQHHKARRPRIRFQESSLTMHCSSIECCHFSPPGAKSTSLSLQDSSATFHYSVYLVPLGPTPEINRTTGVYPVRAKWASFGGSV